MCSGYSPECHKRQNKTFSFGFHSALPQHAPFISLQALCQQHRRFILRPCPWLWHRKPFVKQCGSNESRMNVKIKLNAKTGLIVYARLRFISISTCRFFHCLFQHFAMNSVIHLPGNKCLSLSFIFKPQLGSVHNE